MQGSRREFLGLGVAAAAAAVLPLKPLVRPAVAATALGRRPLPELVPDQDLPVYALDVEASIAKRQIVLKDKKEFWTMPQGCIVEVPAGVKIPLYYWSWDARPQHNFVSGARLILRGERGGAKPLFFSADNCGTMSANHVAKLPIGFELENLQIRSGDATDAVFITNVRYVGIRDCDIEGGRNGLGMSTFQSVAELENTTIFHGGRGDGLTHNVYANYTESFSAKGCKFHSSKGGHAFKCYSSKIDMRGCVLSNWDSVEEMKGGFRGELPVADIGAWANTTLIGNTFVRRGPTRPTVIEYRNRQWAKGKDQYAPPDWGTTVVDYHQVDNRDPGNPYLFRHLLLRNRFINGVNPDGSLDQTLKGATAIRNNGAAPWGSHGYPEAVVTRPSDFKPQNERAVVWAMGNIFEGVPFAKKYDEVPYEHTDDYGPIREVDKLPDNFTVAEN